MPFLTEKVHTTLYKIYKIVSIKTSKIIFNHIVFLAHHRRTNVQTQMQEHSGNVTGRDGGEKGGRKNLNYSCCL